ncbi:ABC transporter ATP-binding protein [Bombilactobacillus mellis]|uniref:ABC transporter ATP-binding protein n=1 Tax=Bombilactobacillus mellis TaxID=1218508 RepID=UPI00157FFE95|nr:ATP-binding cassette domain-containing protein [Bombilactobacillus mellis]MCT6840733.1 ATP-binding cassette domain-containing protein [Bombilactobacillus mellis]MCT6856558.1 ATP-binding cassette domain-containing protein [Bombilactobacillus mellis]MCT6872480.1 ATP-binding cassette domain-containing protein [Bombilactobacillus mellis]NUF26077.1 ABC transporter ATP-binding protein [Bombilactobacillus mellis]NUG39700.1 ABC transporter ATP-binding protein [Bombilactobacillus mellis]
MAQTEKIVQVQHLKQYFSPGKANEVKAVDDISFDIYKGETFGLVGESGSGKSTTGRSIIRLYNPTGGKIIFDGQDISQIKNHSSKMLEFRREVQMIFQDPYASLDPRMKVKDIIAEGLDVHHLVKNDTERNARVEELLQIVGLNPDHATRYPHEFSGGQRQRIGIARALAVDPKFIIADEPISALDVSIQAQVVNLMKDIQRKNNLTYLFIAHDLSMVKYISDRIAVMHQGRLMEMGTADEVYNHPLHPYTKSLLSAVPLPDPELERQRQRIPYDASIEKNGNETHQLREIVPGHFVYSTESEIDQYRTAALQQA